MADDSGKKPDVPLSDLVDQLNTLERKRAEEDGLGYQRVKAFAGDLYKDCSTVVIVPSREPCFHHRIVESWQGLISPMNQKRAWMYCIGDEVGHAYNKMVTDILGHPELGRWKYILTLESDNVIPQDAHIRLIETIEYGKFDAVGGIYFTKGDVNMPMCYGDPAEYARTGKLDFRPREVAEALAAGRVLECNGIAMGCSLFRVELFRQIPQPWFVTVADIVENVGPMGFTQDLWFCKRAREQGKRFAVDMRCKVGHMDLATGVVY